MVEEFIFTVQEKKIISPLEKDGLVWKKAKHGLFTFKSSFDFMEGGRSNFLPRKLFWNQCVPTNVGFYAWEAWWGKMMTIDQLKRRGFSQANRCSLCGSDEENIEHLLIQCKMVWGLWVSLAAMGVVWVSPYCIRDFLFSWKKISVRKDERKIWLAATLLPLLGNLVGKKSNIFDTEDCSFHRMKIPLFTLFALGLACV